MRKVIVIIKRLGSAVLIFMISVAAALAVSAENSPSIIISSPKANIGEEAGVSLSIIDNPGIMAITISITYDSDSLEYIEYSKGILHDYTVADHPESNLIRFVCCENSDLKKDGVLITLKFKVKETAAGGLNKIDIEYSSGDFCNWNEASIMPSVFPGGIVVPESESAVCEHKNMSGWKTLIEPGCITPGKMQRQCGDCGYTEQQDIAPKGHSYNDFWTVDKYATETEKGVMSRHCAICGESTDIVYFDLEQAKENDIPKKTGNKVYPNKLTGKINNDNSSESESGYDDTFAESQSANDIVVESLRLSPIVLPASVVFGLAVCITALIYFAKYNKRRHKDD